MSSVDRGWPDVRRPSLRARAHLQASSLVVALLVAAVTKADDTEGGFDLNRYALGANLFVSQSPFVGAPDFVGVFPLPSLFDSPVAHQEPLFFRDSDFGIRKFTPSGLNFGAVLGLQTLSFGSGETPELVGMRRRDWTVQGGFTVGTRAKGVAIDVGGQTDLLGVHNGQEYTLRVARQFDVGNQYFMPQLRTTYQSANLVNYYFGVSPRESLPGRPQYTPGAVLRYAGTLQWGWHFLPQWFATATATVDFLPEAIRNSPIVDTSRTWAFQLGVSYDAPTMRSARPLPDRSAEPSVDVRLELFRATTNSKVFLRSGEAVAPVDVESDLGLTDAQLSVPLSITWRIAQAHALRLDYLQLLRSGRNDLEVNVDIGNGEFADGESVSARLDTRGLLLAYGYSLLRDTQKELTVFGGLQLTEFSYRFVGQQDETGASTRAVLPVLGIDLRINITERFSVEARGQFFSMDVNDDSGTVFGISAGGEYRVWDRLALGAGFRFYRQDLDSGDENFSGDYRVDYRGPTVFFRALF
jgi:outer membrane scaffolding protein for murein synthesis (MipA/OmpV family)